MGKIFFKNKNGRRSQPYTIEDFKIKGNLYTDDLIWFDGLNNWTKASNIEELKNYAIVRPPLTNTEKNLRSLKTAINPTILCYIIISIVVGISGALLEKNKYENFINSITKTEYTPNNSSNYNDGKIRLTEYSNIKQSDVYAPKEDGNGYYTRWTIYSTVGNQDNSEQRSYEETYKFLFRPYKTFYEIVNLSNEEINNLHILLFNFVYSSFITNLIFIPLLFLMFYFIKRKKTLNKTLNIEDKPNNQKEITSNNNKNNSVYFVLILFALLIGFSIYKTSKTNTDNSLNTEGFPDEDLTLIDTTAATVDSTASIEPKEVSVNTNNDIEKLREFNGGYILDKIEEYEYDINSSKWVLLDKTENYGEFFFDDSYISFYRPSYGNAWKTSLWKYDTFYEKENSFVLSDGYNQKILINSNFKTITYLSNFSNNIFTYCYLFYIREKSEYVKPH